jgi:hypothetical protein
MSISRRIPVVAGCVITAFLMAATGAARVPVIPRAPRVLSCGAGQPDQRSELASRDKKTTIRVPVANEKYHQLVIPKGAIREDTLRFFLAVDGTAEVRVRAWAAGMENGTYTFNPGTTAELKISAHRCSDAAVDSLPSPTLFRVAANGGLTSVGGEPESVLFGIIKDKKWWKTELPSLSVYVLGTN